jgi:hypothetical protein
MEDCVICCDKFTASLRKEVLCPHCHKKTCLACVKRYLLESAKDPHCPHCMKAWSRFFLQQTLPKSFIDNEYAKCRANILWSREESYIPQVQTKAVQVSKAEQYQKEKIVPLRVTLEQLYEKQTELRKFIYQLERELYDRKDTCNEILNGRFDPETGSRIVETSNDSEIKTERVSFKRKCNYEGCLGWLSSGWKCGLCENHTCVHCFKVIGEKKDATHLCDPCDVETAKLIKSSTKPCPKCGEGIEKGEGCDVMFCTGCHTGFNWVTGKILQDSQIHNPHYFEWQARNGAAANAQNPCGTRLGGFMVNRVGPVHRTLFGKIIRIIMHVEDIEYGKYDYHLEHQNNEDLLVDYLLKKKDKDDVKRNIQNRERRVEREKAIRDILETFVMAGKDIVHSTVQNPKAIEESFKDLDTLKNFVNDNLKNVSKLYGCQVPNIIDWEKIEMINVKVKDNVSIPDKPATPKSE